MDNSLILVFSFSIVDFFPGVKNKVFDLRIGTKLERVKFIITLVGNAVDFKFLSAKR